MSNCYIYVPDDGALVRRTILYTREAVLKTLARHAMSWAVVSPTDGYVELWLAKGAPYIIAYTALGKLENERLYLDTYSIPLSAKAVQLGDCICKRGEPSRCGRVVTQFYDCRAQWGHWSVRDGVSQSLDLESGEVRVLGYPSITF